ncbi:BadF/BadG/BcrA/BcrD ATPase family protein [Polaromonas sp.]|uniref:BadF/BadG/BcrA/BcrD ATPase family protein n=1 Tax=Polaromonas sp. TaxID=1869339 RepID=UPI002FC65DFF
MTTFEFLVGVDGGGSGTRAVIYTVDGALLARANAGPSALGFGAAQAWGAIDSAVRQALTSAGLAFDRAACALGLGLAGANHPEWRRQFLVGDPGYAMVHLETDGFACLLGAHGGASGAMVAMGTGSMSESWLPDGTRRSIGGWGFPVGDQGGGAWLGLRAVQRLQQVLDGLCPACELTDAILQRLGGTREAVLRFGMEADATRFAQLAPMVFVHASSDAVAAALLDEAAEVLRGMIEALDPQATLPLSLSGSVALNLKSRLPPSELRPLRPALLDAAQGALLGLCRAQPQLRVPDALRVTRRPIEEQSA